MSVPPDSPLSPGEVQQVLRYWQHALRYEEALANRVRARPPVRRSRPPDMAAPDPRKRSYFKLLPSVPDELGAMLQTAPSVTLPLDGERLEVFERWLAEAYFARGAGGGDDQDATWIAGFPVLHFRREDELATLLRFPVELAWLDEAGEPFVPPRSPRRKPREGKAPPSPPATLRLSRVVSEDATPLPAYSVDPVVLNRTLGVPEEAVTAFIDALRVQPLASPSRIIRALCELLERDAVLESLPAALAPGEPGNEPGEAPGSEPGVDSALLDRLTAAVQARLPEGGVRCWRIGLVHDGRQMAATRQLQRDLADLGRLAGSGGAWSEAHPCWRYLSGVPRPSGRQVHRGHRRPTGLTASQREAAERFLGSRLAAVQGPPGTGKTELILDLAASSLVEWAEGLVASGRPAVTTLVVASTNNRAVDNVIEPLSEAMPIERLPLALRVGSKRVTESRAVVCLTRCMEWLDDRRPVTSAQDATARAALSAALDGFRVARDEVAALGASREAWWARVAERDRARAELAALEAECAGVAEDEVPSAAEREAHAAAVAQLRAADGMLARLEMALEELQPNPHADTTKARRRVATRVETLLERRVAPAVEALAALDMGLHLPLPPDDEVPPEDISIEEWVEGLDAATDEVDEIRDRIGSRLAEFARAEARAERAARIQSLRETLVTAEAALRGSARAAPAGLGSAERAAHHELYVAALAAREAWAVVQAPSLLAALGSAVDLLTTSGSWGRVRETRPAAFEWLERLFPVVGCTLLTMRRAFGGEPNAIARLVVDEAGQCHPAHVVAGLMRARQALIIGDVHQLEPVYGLDPNDEARVRRAAGVTLSEERLRPYRVDTRSRTSAQSLAARAVDEVPTLRDHFRCQAPIIHISDALCGYGLVVHTPESSLAAQVPALRAPVLFEDVPGVAERVRGSWSNGGEVQAVLRWLGALARGGVDWGEVAVLAPYTAQIELLRRRIRGAGFPVGDERASEWADDSGGQTRLAMGWGPDAMGNTGSIALGTVHRFQGGERAVVLLSTVVSEPGRLGFIDTTPNLINVAVSRARQHLVVCGRRDALLAGRLTRLLVERAAEG